MTPAERSEFLDTLTPAESRQMLIDLAERVPQVFGWAVEGVTRSRAAGGCPAWCAATPHHHRAAAHWRDLGVVNGPGLVASLATLRTGDGPGVVRLFADDERGVRHHDLPPALAADLARVLAALPAAAVREVAHALATGARLLMEGTS